MPEKTSNDVPSFEEVQEELGMDAMSFMCEMLRPDPPRGDEED